ncbi:hypothetical protein F5144DRAFT_621471 [Chaetomium tenue]|uniref:Uncharacterized protein n=1 Tax=Chaetomium tenue TaxID=1854479 RepID=A0ACB7P8V1_9PEZI|nr:hypothetical protein F5144DRAFT_621471 [Chaetomium globosum]
MKTTTAIFLIITTLATAAPSPNAAANLGLLSTRQGCSYSCVCQTSGEGEGPSPDTTRCCTGGTPVNEGVACTEMNFAAAVNFVGCCTLGHICTVSSGCDPIPDN